MITGFENITYQLTEEEIELAKLVFKGLKFNSSKNNPKTSKHIVKWFKDNGYKMDGARLRKIVNYLRGKQILPNLIATSKGYYVSDDLEEIKKQVKSLTERAKSQLHVAQQIAEYYDIKMEQDEEVE